MRRTLFLHPDAVRELYRIPRGIAADITKAIRELATNPAPSTATVVPGKPGRYTLPVLSYILTYEDDNQRITVLVIDQP